MNNIRLICGNDFCTLDVVKNGQWMEKLVRVEEEPELFKTLLKFDAIIKGEHHANGDRGAGKKNERCECRGCK